MFSLGRLCSNRQRRVLPSQRIRHSLLSFTEHFRPRPLLPRGGLRSVRASKSRGATITPKLRPTVPAPLYVRDKPSSETTLCSWVSYREPGASLETGRTTLAPQLGDLRRPLSPVRGYSLSAPLPDGNPHTFPPKFRIKYYRSMKSTPAILVL